MSLPPPEQPEQPDQGPAVPPYAPRPGYGAPAGAYPPGQPYGPPGYPSFAPVANGKATAALVTGLSTLLFSWCCGAGVLGAVAIVLGAKARGEIRASGGRQTGDGVALAGMILGAAAIVVGVLALVLIAVALAHLSTHFPPPDRRTISG